MIENCYFLSRWK